MTRKKSLHVSARSIQKLCLNKQREKQQLICIFGISFYREGNTGIHYYNPRCVICACAVFINTNFMLNCCPEENLPKLSLLIRTAKKRVQLGAVQSQPPFGLKLVPSVDSQYHKTERSALNCLIRLSNIKGFWTDFT